MMFRKSEQVASLLIAAVLMLSGCGGGEVTGPKLYSLGGVVNGYSGSGLRIANGNMQLAITQSGQFKFPQALVAGASYTVRVVTQPQSPAQSCVISNGSGVIQADVNNIVINCTTTSTQNPGSNTYTVAGQISGMLAGESVSLRLNNFTSETFNAQSNGGAVAFTFTNAVGSTLPWEVTVGNLNTSSGGRVCSRSLNYRGTARNTNVTNVSIICGSQSTLSVSISGLTAAGLQVRVNEEAAQSVNSNASFTSFARANGSRYLLEVVSHPSGQNCRFNGTSTTSSGTVGSNTSVNLSCEAGSGGGTISGEVQPLFVNNGSNWNDYVTMNGSLSATNRYQFERASDVACNADGSSVTPCLHGGEIRRYPLTSTYTSCNNITAEDSEQALHWVCDDNGSTVQMVSTGFNRGKGLADLIDWNSSSPAWKNMSLTVRQNGAQIAATNASRWWANTILSANSLSNLSSNGAVYYVNQDVTRNYQLTADRVALVVRPLSSISGQTGGNDNAAVSVTGNFNWVEGTIRAANLINGINVQGARYTSVHRSSIEGASGAGLYLKNAERMRVHSVVSTLNGSGVKLDNVNNSEIRALTINANLFASSNDAVNRHGLVVLGSDNNTFSLIRSFNNVGRGIWISNGSRDNRFIDVISANNETGILVDKFSTANAEELSTNQVFQNITLANAGVFRNGLSLSGNGNTVERVAMINNGHYGVNVLGDNNRLEDIASAHNDTGALAIDTLANSMQVAGQAVLVGGCDVQNVTDAPLINSTCAATNGSTAVVTTSGTLSNAVPGKVQQTDLTNPAGSQQTTTVGGAGTILFTNLNDWEWAEFDNDYRGWAPDGNIVVNISNDSRNNLSPIFPSYLQRGPLVGTGNQYVLRLWDWSLRSGTSPLRARFSALSSGASSTSATRTHQWSGGLPAVSYLVHASELMDDGMGNENGLCESYEACVLNPNIGAYQGHGTLTTLNTSFSTSGSPAVSQVEYFRYQQNGY